MQRFTNIIGNEDAAAARGGWIDVVEPATGAVYAQVAASGAEDVARAVEAAKRAFVGWAATPLVARAALMNRLADLIDARVEELARAESVDTGKPIALSRALDVPRAAANLRYFAGAVQHWSTEAHEFDGGGVPGGLKALNITQRRPRGVAGLISPWNLPLYLLTWKIAPAIATGNTCVCKPSEVTPATAFMLGQLVREAGFPAGVVNIVHGAGAEAGAALVEHAEVPTISFTGSTAVGRWIGATAGGMLKRVSLELGGKNAMIVCRDADVRVAADLAARAGFTNQGQVCLCMSRVLVHRRLRDVFIEELVRRVRGLRVGDPMEESTQQGALVSREHLNKVHSYVTMAREAGATIHCGGGPYSGGREMNGRCIGGFFYTPTVISGLDAASRVEQEEIFGPVVSLGSFETDDEAVARANGTAYGLAAVIVSQDLNQAHSLAERVQAGIVWVNGWMIRDLRTPFGGMKQSGVGREGGVEALKFFTEAKNVCVRM